MDYDNPAVSKQVSVSPALLEAVADDPKYLTSLARKMLLMALSRQHKKLMEPDAPVGQRQAHIEMLAKLGDAVPKAAAASTVPFSITFVGAPGAAPQQVQINMPTAENAAAEAANTFALPADVVDAEVKEVEGVAAPADPEPPAPTGPSPADDPTADWDFS